jgi:hypothetical protein
MKKSKPGPRFTYDIAKIAAVLVSIASVLATICWVSSSMAGGETEDYRSATLANMILKLDATTMVYVSTLEANTYLVLADMYSQRALAENENAELKSYYENMEFLYYSQAIYSAEVADNMRGNMEKYDNQLELLTGKVSASSNVSDNRATAALIFAISSLISSSVIILKRREILYLIIPTWLVAFYFLLVSLL